MKPPTNILMGPKSGSFGRHRGVTARRSLVLLFTTVTWAAQGASAQSPGELGRGDRLRVRVIDTPEIPGYMSATTATYVGRLNGIHAGRLSLAVNDSLAPAVFDLDEVVRVEQSLGRRMPAGVAWLIGAGLAGSVAWYSGIGIGGGGAVLGGSVLIGGAVGLLFAREEWRPVPWPLPE